MIIFISILYILYNVIIIISSSSSSGIYVPLLRGYYS